MPVHPFAPVVSQDARVLILGSFPSVQSRLNGFYYGHRQNRFWRLMALLFHEDVPQDTQEKTALLIRRRIALWDVVSACDITGSSDSSLRAEAPNDIPSLVRGTRIEKVLLNGQTAGKLYVRYFAALDIPYIVLPSTSPANAAWSLERLKAAWAPHLSDL